MNLQLTYLMLFLKALPARLFKLFFCKWMFSHCRIAGLHGFCVLRVLEKFILLTQVQDGSSTGVITCNYCVCAMPCRLRSYSQRSVEAWSWSPMRAHWSAEPWHTHTVQCTWHWYIPISPLPDHLRIFKEQSSVSSNPCCFAMCYRASYLTHKEL